ncbi:MAG: stage IV sporulation protein A [Firmicutes bacterium]|nr:stage IV sporulation protein A [Bacillota bacterium]
MENFDLYRDIARRTNGDIYLGVVGPVRAGKSTFITKFMETLVLPNIEDKHAKERTIDELPQAAAGRTIMTTQPKFVPNEAARVMLKDGIGVKVRMVDCVGYLIDGAQGHKEGTKPRMVRTPWSDAEMPFEQAAEMGTKKVITDHSTIGLVVTSDGSIGTEIARSGYIKAEERVINELKELGKPFAVLLNTAKPAVEETGKLRRSLGEKYGVPVIAVDAANMGMDDINSILETVLFEFPIAKIEYELPAWMQTLPFSNPIIGEICAQAIRAAADMQKMRDYGDGEAILNNNDDLESPKISNVIMGEGRVVYQIEAKPGLFYKVLSGECGCEISDDFTLMDYLKQVTHAKKEFDKIKHALAEADEHGYGVVSPTLEQMRLEEPEIVKQGNRFGVKLKASAPSLHIMKVDIETEVNPVVGTEAQSEELVKYLLSGFESDPKGIWETEMFGKTLSGLVKEGLSNKLAVMPADAQKKMRKTLSRIVNEGRGGVICILL